MPVTIKASHFKGKPAVFVGNGSISIHILTGGGHIASIQIPGIETNPLWEPEWNTTTPALRKLVANTFSPAAEDQLENELLACIGGHNICCDVFGAHSSGEINYGGANFHGEAAMCTWAVTACVRLFFTYMIMNIIDVKICFCKNDVLFLSEMSISMSY